MSYVEVRVGDLVSVKGYMNLWDVPCHVSPSVVIENLDAMEPVLVVEITRPRKNYTNSPLLEVKVLTTSGKIGWLALDKEKGDWVVHP